MCQLQPEPPGNLHCADTRVPGGVRRHLRHIFREPLQLLVARPNLADGRVVLLLRDLQAATVLTDIAAWIGDPVTALPSGADRAMNASEQEAAKEPESKQVSGATAPLVLSCQPPTAARP